MATVGQIIGKIVPSKYAKNGKALLKKYGSWDQIPANEVEEKNVIEHKIVYDSSSETLEPIYFWILDFMGEIGLSPEKVVDNFASSPGSGHFGEMGQRMSIMQQQGTKILQDINAVLRSVLNIIYDLKDFKQRLGQYDDLRSKEKIKGDAARLSLKQIWMDKVDINKGNSSIKVLGTQGGFVTLIDAFLYARDEKDANNLDLNERIKRIVISRVQEFNLWVEQSEIELKKRYEIEKTYLKSQVSSLRIYAQWAKPFLAAAQQMQMADLKNPGLVKAFNTIYLELSLLGKTKINVVDAAANNDFPLILANDKKLMKKERDYYACVTVNFSFRGIPQKVIQQQHYAFGGLAEVVIKAYALNSEELKVFQNEVKEDLVSEVFALIEGATTESLINLRKEINYYLEEDLVLTDEEKAKKDKENRKAREKGFWDFFYPFGALLGKNGKISEMDGKPVENKGGKKKEEKKIRAEDYVEKTFLRGIAEKKAEDTAFTILDIYKKAHGMAAFPK